MFVEYPTEYYFTLVYDGIFFVHSFEGQPLSIKTILEIVGLDFDLFPHFDCCNIIDSKTGEVIAIAHNTPKN